MASKQVLLVLVFLSMALLASAYEPIVYLQSRPALLNDSENLGQFATLTGPRTSYYVVQINSGVELSGLLALTTQAEELEQGEVTIRQLFRTSVFIIEYSNFKEKLNTTNPGAWFVGESRIAGNLGDFLDSERTDLDIIASTINTNDVTSLTNTLKAQLSNLSELVRGLSLLMQDATAAESDLLQSPGIEKESALTSALDDVFEALLVLDDLSRGYTSDAARLKALIATADADVDTKISLTAAANLPTDFQQRVGEWASLVSSLQASVQQVESKSNTQADVFVSSMDLRVEREKAHNHQFEDDPQLESKAGANYSSLKKSVDTILAPDNRGLWEDQSRVNKLADEWDKSKSFFDQSNYEKSTEFSIKAKQSVLTVVKAGLKADNKPPAGINTNLLITGGVIIILFLIVLLVLRNRRKLSRFAQGNEDDESGLNVYD